MKRQFFKILLTYKNVSDIGLPVKTQVIIDSMTGNARYPNPPTALAVIQAKKDEYERSLSLAKLGDDRAIATKDLLRLELEALLHELAAYVQGTAKNDPAVLASSGFDISREHAARTTDELSIVASDIPGMVFSTMKSVKGASAYIHMYTPDPLSTESVWTESVTPYRKHILTGLRSNVKYWFRVKALTKNGPVVFTDVVSKTVQ
jgi:hypothetical protein